MTGQARCANAMLQVQIWDADRVKQVRQLRGHSARVSALAWNKSTLSSGGRDTSILNHDIRCAALCPGLRKWMRRVAQGRQLPREGGVSVCAAGWRPTLAHCFGCAQDQGARAGAPDGTHAGGVRPQVVAVRHAACVGWQRQPARHLAGRRHTAAAPPHLAPGCRQGAKVPVVLLEAGLSCVPCLVSSVLCGSCLRHCAAL